jgi:SP family arabinose:H+ symporter-like MFS transporter
MQRRETDALNIMTRMISQHDAEKELSEVKESIEKDKNKEKVAFRELFKPAMKLVLTIGIVVAILQQITGINSVFFYAPMIFEQTGIGKDASFIQAIIIGITNLLFTVVAILFVDRLGRKPLLVFGLIGIVVSMFLLSSSFKSAEYKLSEAAIASLTEVEGHSRLSAIEGVQYNSDLEFKAAVAEQIGEKEAIKHQGTIISKAITINSWLVLIGIIGFVASFAVSLGPVMWILFSELFPNRLRGLAISFGRFYKFRCEFSYPATTPMGAGKHRKCRHLFYLWIVRSHRFCFYSNLPARNQRKITGRT